MRARPGPAWRARGLGSRWQFGVFHGLIRLGGRRLAYALSDLVSLYYVLARPSVRAGCRPYLERRFPGRRAPGRLRDAFRLSRAFARILVDRAALRLLGRSAIHTDLAGRAALQGLLAEGRGLVIVTAHVGAWQLGMASLGTLDHPVAILTRLEEGDGANPFASSEEGASPFRLIDPAGFLGGVPEMLAVLQAGGVVAIMGDRALGATTPADFLGGPLALPYSPYKLASATGAPVAVLFPYKPEPDRVAMRLARVIRVPADLGRDPRAYAPYAQAFADALGAFTDEFPYHFFNFYDLWKEPPPPGGAPR